MRRGGCRPGRRQAQQPAQQFMQPGIRGLEAQLSQPTKQHGSLWRKQGCAWALLAQVLLVLLLPACFTWPAAAAGGGCAWSVMLSVCVTQTQPSERLELWGQVLAEGKAEVLGETTKEDHAATWGGGYAGRGAG